MSIIIKDLSYTHTDKEVLFSNLNLIINSGEKTALTGNNGCGKSTLMRILAGEASPGTGSVHCSGHLYYVPQHFGQYDDRTVAQVLGIDRKLTALHAILNGDTAEEHFARLDNDWNIEERTQAVLHAWHLNGISLLRPLEGLSGGEKTRLFLAGMELKEPDTLLLDEPTNHLDTAGRKRLYDFVHRTSATVLVISHDRKFVDNITTRTIEVTMGRIYDYKVNYSQYLQLRQERRIQQQKAYDEQQKFIAETKEFIERFKGTYSKTLQVQSRVKMLEKLVLLEVDEEDTSALRLKFPPSPRSGNYPVIMENVGKTYGDHIVFKNANLTIERGDKVAFVGKNGEGKSTLVKCIMGEIEHEGTLTIGHNVQIGYFAQNQASLLDENLTVFQTIDDVAKGEIRNKIRDLLGAFMFGGPEESMKKVKVLSGGERTRLAMIKLLLEPVNLLILDEPTNHLDMKTKDILKQALMDFDGTLILVSHDRDFLDGLVSKVYEFGNKRVTEHLSGIYEFLEKKKMDSLRELER